MIIERIEEYRQQNSNDILKIIFQPSKAFPNGSYFYTDASAIDLVQNYNWCLAKDKKNIYVTRFDNRITYKFHRDLCYFYLGYYADYLDHINSCGFDNTDQNVNVVSLQQNNSNRFSRGYILLSSAKQGFKVKIRVNGEDYFPYKTVHREDEVCICRSYTEQIWLKEKLGNDWYMFDFKKYRRGSEDILDLERTGVISEEEATYKHILKYSDNAWYMLRYGLEQYFKDNHIPIPKYSLDENGFMIHPITGQKLCPF